jgi:hypothetical protein
MVVLLISTKCITLLLLLCAHIVAVVQLLLPAAAADAQSRPQCPGRERRRRVLG